MKNKGALSDWGLAALRVVVGVVFVAHGWRKVLAGFEAVSKSLAGHAIPFPFLSAVVVTMAEVLCGIALVIGIRTRLATVPLMITMLVAMLVVHLGSGFFLPKGYEFTLVLLAALIAIAAGGSGALALDKLFKRG